MKYTNFIKSTILEGYFTDEPQNTLQIQFYETEIFVWNKYIIPIVRKTTSNEVKRQQGFGVIEMRDFERYFELSNSLAKRSFKIKKVFLGSSDTYHEFNGHSNCDYPDFDSVEGYEKCFMFSESTQLSIDRYAKRRRFYDYLCCSNCLDKEIFKKVHEELKSSDMKYSDKKYQRFCQIRRMTPYGLARIHSKPLEIQETVKSNYKLAIFPFKQTVCQ